MKEPAIQLGFASAIVPEMSLSDIFLLAAEIGYDCVEVMCWPISKAERRYAGVTHIDIAGLVDTKIAEIQQLVARTGGQISALGYYPNCLSPDLNEAVNAVKHLKQLFHAQHGLGVWRVITLIVRD